MNSIQQISFGCSVNTYDHSHFSKMCQKNKILSSLISILATILTILYKLILLFSVKVIIKLNDGLDLFSNLTYLLLEWHKQSKNMTIFKGTFKI